MFISDSIKYVGVDDKDIDLFESQYVVPDGVSYNSYIIFDEKITIMDTVDARATDEWVKNIEEALGGKEPSYLVISHLEPDHAANIGLIAHNIQICSLSEMQKLSRCFHSSLMRILLTDRSL